MEDPHVEALFYHVRPEEGVSYQSPSPVIVSEAAFDGELSDERFIARMLQHFPTEEEARLQVDSYLRAWEISAAVQRGRPELRFIFDHADVVERAPTRPGEVRVFARGARGVLT